MGDVEIANLPALLTPILGNRRKVVDVQTCRLTSAGENYASLMLALTIKVADNDNSEQTLHAVAKLLPPNDFLNAMFNTQFTFRNELAFYKTIAPCLRNFQREQGMTKLFDSYPQYYGGRLNLDPSSTTIDKNAALIMQNIQCEGYTLVDRTKGFDLEAAKLILTVIAELHASCMGLKQLKPAVFQEEIMPYFDQYHVFPANEDVKKAMFDKTMDIIKDDEVCSRYLVEIRRTFEINGQNITAQPKNWQEHIKASTFLGFTHSDLWINNIMVKKHNDKIIDVKLVDFQLYEYGSVTRDLIFFLFTSVQSEVIAHHYETLIEFYYETLIKYLTKLNCNVSSFTFEAFKNEITIVAQQFEFFHIVMMLRPMFAKQETAKVVDDINMDSLSQPKDVSNEYREKACFISREFIKRGWLL